MKDVIVQPLQNDNYHHDGMCVDLRFTKPVYRRFRVFNTKMPVMADNEILNTNINQKISSI